MNKDVLRLLLLAMGLALIAPTVTLAAEIKTERGELAQLIARLSTREFVLGEPLSDSRPYVDPAPVLHNFRHLASELAWGDPHAAARKAEKLGYEVVEFTDVPTGRTYLVLREDLAAVETLRGWGSYIVNPHSRIDALVEVPHPFADVHTPEIGGLVFAECQARGFLLSGSHREKADVPDLVESVFHQVHVAWVGPTARVAAWQIHGFSSIKHGFPRDAQVVASTGDGTIVPAVATLDRAFENHGLASYVFNELPAKAKVNRRLNGGVPGVTFSSLAAAKNEQGRYSRSLGGSFVHVELEGNLRSDATNRKLASSAIATVIAEGPGPDQQVAASLRSQSRHGGDANNAAPKNTEAAAPTTDATTTVVAAKPADVEPLTPAVGASPVLAAARETTKTR